MAGRALSPPRAHLTCALRDPPLLRPLPLRLPLQYPSLKYEEVVIDSAMLHMASNPSRFDVMVMPNLYGDIAS